MTTHAYLPGLIFNLDETMLHPGKNHLKVIVRGNGGRPTQKMQTKGEHITFALCVAANGDHLKPLVILPLKTLPDFPPELTNMYTWAGQQSGWMDKLIYQGWIYSTLIPHIKQIRDAFNNQSLPALLVVDGHNSRECPITTQLLRDNNIQCICMPAHSSTVLQPLDLTVNGEFKRVLGKHWKPILGEPLDIKRIRLLQVSGLALDDACSKLNIITGFAKAGISPFSLEAPLNSSLVRDPLTQWVPERKAKKKQGVDISGKVLTDNTVIVPLQLGDILPQQQIAAPRPRKKKKADTPTPTSTALIASEK